MQNSIYQINKGINKSIEFKGLKAQYIWYLGGGLIGLLILFAAMYFIGFNTFVCLGIIVMGGTALFMYVYKLSSTYGEYGMMKKLSKRRIPDLVKSNTRKIFFFLPKPSAERCEIFKSEHNTGKKVNEVLAEWE